MFSIIGEGFNIYISLIEKETVNKINKLISSNKYKKSSFTHDYKKNAFNIFGVNKSKYCFAEDFSEKKVTFTENKIDIHFEKDMIYFITIEEISGDIFYLEELEELQIGETILELDEVYQIYTNFNKKTEKGKFIVKNKKQFLVYTQAGIIKKLRIL